MSRACASATADRAELKRIWLRPARPRSRLWRQSSVFLISFTLEPTAADVGQAWRAVAAPALAGATAATTMSASTASALHETAWRDSRMRRFPQDVENSTAGYRETRLFPKSRYAVVPAWRGGISRARDVARGTSLQEFSRRPNGAGRRPARPRAGTTR